MEPVRKYVKGVVVRSMDSRREWQDSDADFLKKKIFVRAEKNEIGDWELVATLEIETVNEVQNGGEIYRLPFPEERGVLRKVLLLIRQYPKFFIA